MNKYLLIFLLTFISISQAEPKPNNAAEQHKKEMLEYGQLHINDAGRGFECAGVEMFDEGAAMDGPVYYADVKTRKIICVASMTSTISIDPNENNKCPPSVWVKNACWDKVDQVRRLQRERNNAHQP